MHNIFDIATAFVKDEDGAALTEYLVLIGLITAAVVGATIGFGNALSATFVEWTTWVTNTLGAPAAPVVPPPA